MHELHVQGKKLCQTGHHASIFGDFLGLFCVNLISVAPRHYSGDYFLIYNLCSTMPSFGLSLEDIHKEEKKQPISFTDPSMQLISKHEPQDPSVGSTTYWSGNSQSRILVYNFCEGSPFSIIIKRLQTLKHKIFTKPSPL
ncbi:hypothetical protein H5410_008406 [Solanum commersonii]|uniref:Uncharacterized protein n=1 Tax=Solanum commersonii TaxID=4109 RepID=A0A9J6AFX2_SOLCO|nr:hypothetical protein H5410_008406 [Solanum commersonii]